MIRLLPWLAGCSAPYTFADVVVDAPGADGVAFGDPNNAVNGVRGAGESAGGFDVYSLSIEGENHTLVLGFSELTAPDVPGVDLVVFENGFVDDSGGAFMDQVVVSVSVDGERWATFPHDYLASDETLYSNDPADWSGFAGVEPVLFHVEDNPVDPLSPAAGGDAFDFADLPAGDVAADVQREGAAFVRLQVAATVLNPDTNEGFVFDPVANGADIDGVVARTP